MGTATPIDVFRSLHDSGCFVLPNPWNVGSARYLQSLGFSALATTSAGLAFALGRPDTPTALDLPTVLDHIRAIVEATPLPVNADFQAGYGTTASAVADSVAACVDTGVAGLSIEDATGDDDAPLFPMNAALDRIRAARGAIDRSGRAVMLTARCEAFLVGDDRPLQTCLRRLVAFADAGADCLYAPGLREDEDIRFVVQAVAPKPVNVLVADPQRMSVAQLAALGVRRISIGSAMARLAWRGLMDAAREITDQGRFGQLANAASFATLNGLFGD